ncbi:MAG TPA: TIGR03085 family metal-binding protein [Acidimicrobiales bacterium]
MAEVLFDATERQQLCDLLVELGPDAPTLLQPWTTRDLAAHLVLREHDYIAAPGLVIPGRWHRFAERRTATLKARDFASLVYQVRAGPPPGFFRLGWVRRFPNLNEFFVHHEDVRRANDLGPRSNAPGLDAALWRNVARAPWLLARRLRGVGLELEWAGTNERVQARRGKPTARLVGAPGELLLFLFGRRTVAQVELDGESAAVFAVRETAFGM